MVGGHQKIFNVIFFNGLHSLDSFSAAVLVLKIVHRHSLDIAEICHGNDRVVVGNQILDRHIVVKTDLCSSVIPIFF